MVKSTRVHRLGATASALIAAGALMLAGCASTPTGTATTPADGSTPTAGGCGSVPNVPANDPNGLLGSLDKDLQAGYNAYPDKILASSWAGWKSTKSSGFTAAIVGQAPASPFIALYQKTIKDTLTADGVKVVLDVAPNDPTDVPGQIQMFNQALSQKPDVIFFNPAAPDAAVSLVTQAKAAGIPVIIMAGGSVDSPDSISVTYNQGLQAMTTTSEVASAMGGKGSMLSVAGIPGIPPTTFWENGVKATLALCPDIKIVATVQGLFQPPVAQQAVVQYLATNPAGVDGVVQNGTMGWAIRDAFLQAGQPVPPIADEGGSQGMVAYAMANPKYPYVGTATPTIPMAKQAVQIALKTLEGAGPKVNHVVYQPYLIDRSNIASIANSSWSVKDGSDLSPDGVFMTDKQTAEFFNHPELGPQSAD